MTLCVIDGTQCCCQPDEKYYCRVACERLESLQAENARLTSEVARLREENESFWKIYPDLRMYMNACVLDADWTAWDEDVRQRLMAIGLRKLETLAKP